MTPEDWQRIRPILESVLELEYTKRAAFLDEVCREPSLRHEIESLVAAHDQAGATVLNHPVEPSLIHQEEVRFHLLPGTRLGAYEILEEIAHGGMGAVYRAVRADGQYKQQVALKIVRTDLGTGVHASRLRNERQILAALDHPNIAKILDGGTTEDGLPYFVMELIEGEPIDQYCNQRKLSITERLSLFVQVCSAVQYAHQRLIIHRDIKPSNILVTTEGTARLLDFGIAKILDTQAAIGQIEPTQTMFRVLTPAYASPEQIKEEPITTASDVYALGVVLYELLTGHHPYRRTGATAAEIAHAVCTVEPEKPSTAVRRSKLRKGKKNSAVYSPTTLPPSAGRSGGKPSRQLRGDLDNIVLMALRKEPQRRYASVEQFAEDVRRHLDNLPLVASGDAVRYRISKFIRRHRAGVAVTALVTVALLAALATTVYEAHVARRQSEIARQQRAQAELRFNDLRQVANSFMFEFNDSIKNLAGATPARELLVKRSKEYLDRLAQDAKGDASLQEELATAYMKLGDIQGNPGEADLGDLQAAKASYQKALAITEPLMALYPSEQSLQSLTASLDERVALHSSAQDCADLLRKVVDIREALLRHDPTSVQLRRDLGSAYAELSLYFGNPYSFQYVLGADKGLAYARKSLEIREPLLNAAPNDAALLFDVFESHHYVADMLWVTGHPQEALHYQMSIRSKMKEFLDREPTNSEARRLLLTGDGRIIAVLEDSGQLARARNFQNAGVQGIVALGAKDTGNVMVWRQEISGYNQVGQLALRMGDIEDAVRDHRKAVALSLSVMKVDPTNPNSKYRLADSYERLGNALAARGNTREAEDVSGRAVEIRKSLMAADPSDARVRYALAVNLLHLGNIQKHGNSDQSLRTYQAGISTLEPMVKSDPSNWLMGRTLADLYSSAGLAIEHLRGDSTVAHTGSRSTSKPAHSF